MSDCGVASIDRCNSIQSQSELLADLIEKVIPRELVGLDLKQNL
jgi:hypothetical protein